MQAKLCQAQTRSGARCQANAGESGFCFFHDPSRAAERAKAHRRGGLAKLIAKVSGPAVAIANVAGVLVLVNAVILDTWEQENTAARSRALLAAGELAIKALQIGELEERVKRLEEKGK